MRAAMLCMGLAAAGLAGGQELRFSDVSAEAGFWDVPTAWGVTAVDVDDDGDIDLLMANNGSENALYYNEGHLRFRGRPVIGGPAATESMVPTDVDGDGRLDFLACAWGGELTLFRGRGDGRFDDITKGSGLLVSPGDHVAGASFGDLDGDGLADLHVPDAGKGDRLYVKQDGTFVDVTEASLLPKRERSEHSVMADFNGDGRLDIYVSRFNDQSALYLNEGAAIFSDQSDGTDSFTAPQQLGSCVFDADGDGDLDLLLIRGRFALEQHNILLLNNGDGTFVDGTPELWLDDQRHHQSGSVGDVDNDGDLDLFIVSQQGCTLWLNDGRANFTPALETMPWNEFPGSSAVLCDFDADGDLDLLVRVRPSAERPVVGEYLYRNELNNDNWLVVKPRDAAGHRFCHGAQVRVYVAGGLGDPDKLVARRDITSGCGWSAHLPFLAHFGLPLGRYDVELLLADGARGVVEDIPAGKAIEVRAR